MVLTRGWQTKRYQKRQTLAGFGGLFNDQGLSMGRTCVGEPSAECLKNSALLEKPSILRLRAFRVLKGVIYWTLALHRLTKPGNAQIHGRPRVSPHAEMAKSQT